MGDSKCGNQTSSWSHRPTSTPHSDTISLLQPSHVPGPMTPWGCLIPALAVAHSLPSWRNTPTSSATGGRCRQTFLIPASCWSSSRVSSAASLLVHACDPAQLGHTPSQLCWSSPLVTTVPIPPHASHAGRPPFALSTPNHPMAPRRLDTRPCVVPLASVRGATSLLL